MSAGPVRSPMILQMDAAECGPTALAIVLAWHGRWVPLSVLRGACGVSRSGSKASSLLKVAGEYGLRAEARKKTVAELRAAAPPFIVFWQATHYLVVDGLVGDTVHLNDPAWGHRTVTVAEFERAFTGVTLLFSPGPGFVRAGRPPSVLVGLLRRLRGMEAGLGFIGISALLRVIPTLCAAAFLQVFVDEIVTGRQPGWLNPLLIGVALTVVAQVGLGGLQRAAFRRVRTVIASDGSRGFLRHLLSLPVQFHGQRSVGELASRTALNDSVADVAGGQLALALIDSFMVGLYALVMLWYDAPLTLWCVAGAVVGAVGITRLTRARAEAQARHLQTKGRGIAVAVSGLRDIETIKAAGLEHAFYGRWSSEYVESVSSGQELARAGHELALWTPTTAAFTSALVLLVGGLRVVDGTLTLGALVGFQLLVGLFHAPLIRLLARSGDIQAVRGDLARLDDVLAQPAFPTVTMDAPPPPAAGRVEMRGVAFGFDGVDDPLIDGFDLDVPPGGWVGLVGPSGSGKSTLARLLAGLYVPRAGEIRLDGLPLSRWSEAAFGQRVAFVDQDIVLFEGSVRDNLTLWDPDVPEEALVRACRDAAILDVVQALPGGFDAPLREGAANLSGGQRQRLELARALVRDPVVLLLDEATSALDNTSERAVIANLRARGCTVIVVAHRLSTVRDCDTLLVLQAGEVVERGTPGELAARDGVYAQMLRDAGDAA